MKTVRAGAATPSPERASGAAVVVALLVAGGCSEPETQAIVGVRLEGSELVVEFTGTLAAEDLAPSAFRVSVAVRDGESTTYYDPDFFFDAESFSCCDLECGPYNYTNVDCQTSAPMCMSCRRIGPASTMTISSAEIEGMDLRLMLSHELSEAACQKLASAPSVLFVHYSGEQALTVDGEDVPPLGAQWVGVETSADDLMSYSITLDGRFPLIPSALGVSDCGR